MEKDVGMKDIAVLLSDSNFIRLQKERSAFNTFAVLGLQSHEIRHSNVLAWLFDPQESHKFGFAFLEQFLLKLASCANPDAQSDNITHALHLLAQGGMHVSVRREEQSKGKKRVDLQIECFLPNVKNKRCGFVILVENKVHAKQGNDQLAEYLNHAEKIFLGEDKDKDNVKIIPVYLTLDKKDKPSGERGKDYFHMTYDPVLEILESFSYTADSEQNVEPTKLFIKDYIKTLKELSDMDEKAQKYAKEIYRKYKNVIDFINNTGTNSKKEGMTNAGNRFIDNADEDEEFKIEPLKSDPTHFYFIDELLKKTEGGNEEKDNWRSKAVCGYFFEFSNKDDANGFKGKLDLFIEVGPFVGVKKNERQKLLDILFSKLEIKKTKTKTKTKEQYTRLSYKGQQESTTVPGSIKINDVTDVDEVAAAMKELFEETKEMRKLLHKGINEWQSQS